MRRFSRKIRNNDKGTSIVEYCLLLALISLSSAAGISQVGNSVNASAFVGVAQELGADMACAGQVNNSGGGSECTHDLDNINYNTLPDIRP